MNRIKELRKTHNVNQSKLANLLSVQHPAVSKYENGNVPLTDDVIRKVAQYFNVSTDKVLGYCPFSGEQLSKIKTFLNAAIITVDMADVADSGDEDLYNLMCDIADGAIMPTYEDLLQIADGWRFSLDEMFGSVDIVNWQKEKLATFTDGEFSAEFIQLFGKLSRTRQYEAVRYLQHLVSLAEQE